MDLAAGGEGVCSVEEAEVRRKAAGRSWVCPGAGFASIGRGAWAVVTFGVSLCVVPAVAWLAFRPAAISLWAVGVVVIVATGLWVGEQIAVWRVAIKTPKPSVFVSGYVVSGCVVWVAVALSVGLLVTAFATLRMAGSGMKPTLEPGEMLVYHRYVDWASVTPGAVIVYGNPRDSAWGEPGWIVISRLLAGPGDEISIQDGRYLVNGAPGPAVADTGKYVPVLDIPASPKSATVPGNCYFAVQDSPEGGFDSRVLSWVHSDDIVGSRIWYVSPRRMLKRVE